jgi:hypothetical protein
LHLSRCRMPTVLVATFQSIEITNLTKTSESTVHRYIDFCSRIQRSFGLYKRHESMITSVSWYQLSIA